MIETKRLILRQWRLDDAGALYKYASDKRVSEPALWPCHESVEMSQEMIETVFIPYPHTFAIVLKEMGEPVGCIGLVPQGAEHHLVEKSEREVGYWIGYPFWGKGLSTEALAAFIGYCRDLSDVRSLLITTNSRSVASQRVAEKCGFRFVEDYMHEDICSKAYNLSL